MNPFTVFAVTAVAFAVGMLVGWYVQRTRNAPVMLEARQTAAQEFAVAQQALKNAETRATELASTVAHYEARFANTQQAVVQLSSDLATARTTAARVPELEAEVEEALRGADDIRQQLQGVKIQLAEALKALEQIDVLRVELARATDRAAALEQAREEDRKAATAQAERFAQAQASLEAAQREAKSAAAELSRVRGSEAVLQQQVLELAQERSRLASELEAEKRAAVERAADAERSREQVRAEIQVLAARLLDEKGKLMLTQSHEGLHALLKPVAEKLKEFEARVEKTYDTENRDRASLMEHLRRLQETQTKLHTDAEALSRALTGQSKAQGDWGELILERVLETAGLTEGREYDLQVTHFDEEGGRKRPDALVYLPGNRVIVVDAKCSLTAFVQAMRATDDAVRDAALDAHVASLRAHVRGLASKNYQHLVKERTVDIVLLFVPNEAAFQTAITREAGLYEEAFRQAVVICSPTTLLAALQLISHVWRSENQNANAQKIADEAGKLLEKFKSFVSDLDEVGSRLEQAQTSFRDARSKLATGRGNVMRRAVEIVKLGARVKPDTAQALALEGAGEEDTKYLLTQSVEAAAVGKVKEPAVS
jgi:DNA recombination protein RmuC